MLNKRSIGVLFVDDEEEFVASMSKALGRRGFEITSAAEGRAALEMLASQPFDVILLDVKMPGLDGDAVFREIRRNELDAPVVMLTGHGSVQQAFSLSKEGVFEYLAKPCEVEALASVLRRAAASRTGTARKLPQIPTRVLLAVDRASAPSSLRGRFESELRTRGLDVLAVRDADEAFDQLRDSLFDVVVVALEDGATLIKLKRAYPLVEVLAVVPEQSGTLASELVRNGAFDLLDVGAGVELLLSRIRAAHDRRRERLDQARTDRVKEILARQPD